MKPTFIGFGPTAALAVIFWIKDDDIVSKTVCYSEQDIEDMKGKFSAPSGFYSKYDGYEINYLKSRKVVA